ncbi:MAG: YjbF family lipoprotein [Alphaproteobacteria bacterium]|nr:YjbF family lipoprotein [Alphaproteobacteria bacterium]
MAAVLLAAGCGGGSSPQGDWGDVYTIVTSAFGRQPGVTIQEAAAIPFATIGVRLDGGPEGILVLASSNVQQQQIWTSASHIVLQTQNGRILRTAGLPHNRTDIRLIAGTNGAPPLKGSTETRWEEDFADIHLYSVPVVCRSIVRGREGVKNFTSVIPTVHIDEECRSDTADWSFVNSYWVSPKDGQTWRSIQYVSPKIGPLEINLLRAPTK